ncbi:phosphate ABC transporter substrate-binding protein PstS [Amnibacterium endophyticum]|uniref:Phosphate-binding protein n=1 Tax=Amnibacterium endophyticum TaxID=2109337 RepID=A0ABW4LF46_9MICO
MKNLRAGLAIGTAVTAMIALSSCASNEGGTPAGAASGGSSASTSVSGTLNGVGSSAQGTAQDTWRAAFQQANSGVTVNYNPSGSGAGRTAFIAGGAQFAGSDSYLKDSELSGTFALCDGKAIDIPVYISPIALVYNVEGVKSLQLDPATVAKIFKGDITKWNDPEIAKQNSGEKLPNATIDPVHRSDDSGTTNNFTNYLHAVAPSVWTQEASDTFPYKTGDGANGTSGVIQAVQGGSNAIGYADLSKAGDLDVAKIKVGDKYVAPSTAGASAVAADSEQQSGRETNDLAINVNRTTTNSDEYPLTLISNAIVCQTYKDSSVGSLVKAYMQYVTSDEAQQAAEKAAGSAPLSGNLKSKVDTAVASIK